MRSDYYAVLGVLPQATQAEIKRAYRRKARQTHPDLNDAPNAEQQFKRINEAYEVLSNPKTRARYDFGRSTTHVETKTSHPYQNVVWSHTVYTSAEPRPQAQPTPAAPATSDDPLITYWQHVPVRILTMLLMMTLSLSLMGSIGAMVASTIVVLTLFAAFALHLYAKQRSLKDVQTTLLTKHRATMIAVVGGWLVVPGVSAIVVVVDGGTLLESLTDWFRVVGIFLRLTFALISMVIFSSLYSLREEVDRLHGRKY